MYCSAKFFDPTVIVFDALAESFLISAAELLEPDEPELDEVLFESLLLLPHAASATAATTAARRATRPRTVLLVMLTPILWAEEKRSVAWARGRRTGRP